MNSALHGASLSPHNVIPAKAGIQAPGLFPVPKTTPDKIYVVPVGPVRAEFPIPLRAPPSTKPIFMAVPHARLGATGHEKNPWFYATWL
ncbi:MAG: hypothetical protein Q7R39_14150 [Dehalococcoidia bacterium]|nr:hypothetical protein [Dehalococcoidia bacterium]